MYVKRFELMNLHEVACLGNDGHHEGVLQPSVGHVHQLEPTYHIHMHTYIHTYIHTLKTQHTYMKRKYIYSIICSQTYIS